MNLTEMKTEVRSIINEADANNTHISDTQITAWLNAGVRWIIANMGGFKVARSYTSVAGGNISLNANTLSIQDVYMYRVPSNKTEKLVMVDYSYMDIIDPTWQSSDTQAGIPVYFVRLTNSTARLHPPPNSDNIGQTITVRAIEFPASMSAGTDTPDLPLSLQDLIPHYASWKCFLQLQKYPEAGSQLKFFNDGLKLQRNEASKSFGSNQAFKFIDTVDD